MKTKIETLVVRRRIFFTVARDSREYTQNILPTEELAKELHRRHVDIFTFLERKWCCPITEPSKIWARGEDNVAILGLKSYDEWWENIGKKTRNMIRKAEKVGIKTDVAAANDKLAEGIWKLFNETPVRQGRSFPHYGVSLEFVKRNLKSVPNSTYIGAYFRDELVGFIHLIHGDRITIISQLLSLQKHWDKSVNNALMAKAVEFCANNHIEWVMYGRMGSHPTLDSFKESNGFKKFPLTRYFLPLTYRGKLAIKLKMHRELKDTLPPSMKKALFPLYNWASRTRMRIKTRARPKRITW
jgi:hypothetical protein